MAIELRFAGFDTNNLRVVVSPLTELMAILHVWAEPDHHFDSSAEVQAIARNLDERTIAEFDALSPLWARFRARFFFPVRSESNPTFERELAGMAALPIDVFVSMAAEAVRGFSKDLPAASELLQDQKIRREFLETCRSRSLGRFELAEQLLEDPEAFRERIINFCSECWNSFFGKEWVALSLTIGRAAAQLSGKLNRADPIETIASLSVTAKAFHGTSEVRFDKLQQRRVQLAKRQLMLVPSRWIGNHLTVKDNAGYPVIIHFPAQTPQEELLQIQQVRDRLSALSADSRMELFRHISAEPMTTSELAGRLGQPAAQISRSLRVLREAGLVVSDRHGKMVYHRIDTATVLRMGPDLLATLTR
ncbi:transcriptional regulator [Arthrobacter sp. 7749]|nr:transcriptional regulator [Arthrobacter sp. 7749]